MMMEVIIYAVVNLSKMINNFKSRAAAIQDAVTLIKYTRGIIKPGLSLFQYEVWLMRS
jgi:hypothetical protein